MRRSRNWRGNEIDRFIKFPIAPIKVKIIFDGHESGFIRFVTISDQPKTTEQDETLDSQIILYCKKLYERKVEKLLPPLPTSRQGKNIDSLKTQDIPFLLLNDQKCTCL